MRGSRTSRLPQVRIELAVQPVNIDLTTDSLNQLLVLQNSFIKVGGCVGGEMVGVWVGRGCLCVLSDSVCVPAGGK